MTNKKPSRGALCYYCHNPGHVRQNCRKLQNKNQIFQFVHYQKSLKSTSTFISTLVESGKTNTCLISSSFIRVIDSRATDHMTGYSSLFTTFQSHPSTSIVYLADGSTSCILGSRTIHATSQITFTSVLSLPQLYFNLTYVSKLTHTLNCSSSIFPDYCLIQDLSTKQIIGRGREYGGLYILKPEVPNYIAYSRVAIPFKLHFHLGHPSLSLLKKLCPQLSSLSSLNYESCQYAKLHRVHLSPRVNKRASAPFELVHSDVWGPCPVMSPTRFKYFVTFIDDFSLVTRLYLMKNRSEFFSHFNAFCAEIQTQFHVSVQTLRSDNAKEYLSKPFQSFMLQHKILHQTSCV